MLLIKTVVNVEMKIYSHTLGPQSPGARSPGSPSTPDASGGGLGAHSINIKAEEIVAVLKAHPEGLTIGQLHKKFGARLANNQPKDRQMFVALVKTNSKWGPDKLLRTK